MRQRFNLFCFAWLFCRTNNLLALAKELYLNEKFYENSEGRVFAGYNHMFGGKEFSPSENPTQMVELMERFGLSIIYWEGCEEPWEAEQDKGDELLISAYGKSPMEAVLNCALQIMEVRK